MSAPKALPDRFDIYNRARLESTVLEDIWRQAYGEDYATEARPNGFYPLSVLGRIVATGGSHTSGRTLLDIGCGYGKTGLFLAHRMKMKLFGIDASPVGIELAQKNAEEYDVAAKFWVADASSTGLEDGSCAIVTCLDVLLYISDKPAFLKEIRRILESEGLFAFTTWEQHGYNERLSAQQYEDYQPLFEEAGFDVQSYEAVPGAREQQGRLLDGLISCQDAVRADVGELPADMFANMAKSAREELSGRRYVFGIARRKGL